MSKNYFKILYSLLLCITLLGFASALTVEIPAVPSPPPHAPLPYIPQFVLISFDGSKSVDIWKNIRLFKDEIMATGKSLNVTHFINAAYFLTKETKNLYQGPGHERGKSNIGFSDDLESLRVRIEEVNKAIADGDEIASHTVGHFSGASWTKDKWFQEFTSFDKIIFGLPAIYSDKNFPKLALHRSDIIGFRAPFLDRSSGLYEALHEAHFAYDASEIGSDNLAWPFKDSRGMWHIPLGTIALGKNRSRVLAMDYNILMHHSHGKNTTMKKGTPEWTTAYDDTLAAFLAYFNENYTHTRAPVLVGYHFEEWNDGVYWEVLKEFASQVCGKPEVKCGTFKELVGYMDQYGVPKK